MEHRFFDFRLTRVVQDQLVDVKVGILDLIEIFIVTQQLSHASIGLHGTLFSAERSGKIDLELP